jgi:hypothetical protein
MRGGSSCARIPTIVGAIAGSSLVSHAGAIMECILHGDWIRMERGFLRPLSFSPCDNNVANAEGISMLGAKMLNYSFEAVKPGINLASISIAQEEFFPELFC